MDIEPQNELLLQMTGIIVGEKGRVQNRKEEFISTCESFRKVLRKLEIVLDILEK